MALTVASVVITTAICYGLVHILMWHWRRRHFYKLASKFEGPPVLPLIGNAHLLIGNSEYLVDIFNHINDTYLSPWRLWLGPKLWIFISEPEQLKVVCLSPKTLEKGEVFANYTRPLAGTGLLIAPVSIWKVHRKLIQPTFNQKNLDSFVEVFAAQSKILTEQMKRNLNGPEFEVFHLVALCTLDIVCEAAMGVKVEAQRNRNCCYVNAAQESIATMCKRIVSVWLHPDFIFNLSQTGRDQQKHIKSMHDFTDNVIKRKKKELLERYNQRGTADDEDNALESSTRMVFLDHLLRISNTNASLSDEAIRHEVGTMVIAGNDSTAIANANTLLMLASHPEVQEKAWQELYEIYGDDDVEIRPVEVKDLPRMKYLERVIKESMRLFPVIPFLMRAVTDDLDIGDHTLPKGATAVLGVLPLHRNEKYWPDPLKFDPDRFLPENITTQHPYAYMAFSGGPRNCIGLAYGMMAMKTLIATVLRRYILIKDNIIPPEDIRLKIEIVLKTVDPIKIRIENRNKN